MPQSVRADKASANKPPRPRGGAAPELLEGEQPDPRVGVRGGPRGLGVAAPRGQEQADVVQVGMGRHVLERLCAKGKSRSLGRP